MRYDIFASDNSFGISSMGYCGDTNITYFGPAQRNNYIIHYVISGRGYFNGNPVNTGEGFLITPKMLEHYYYDKDNPWEFVWAIFEEASNGDVLFKEYAADPKTHIFKFKNISTLTQMKNTIIKNNNKVYRSSELYEKYLHIFNNHGIEQKNEKDSETMYYNYAINFINSNLFHKITVDELVKRLGISQPYLYNIFIKKATMSPKQYIDTKKTQKAKELLLETSMQITEIANSIGIEDCITFSKFFKKQVGTSPSNFRKENEPTRKLSIIKSPR